MRDLKDFNIISLNIFIYLTLINCINCNDCKYSVPGFNKNMSVFKQYTALPCIIDNDLVLNKKKSPYIVEYDIVVKAGISLTIQQGVEIYMKDSANITVNGELHIEGTKQEPVCFSPVIDTNICGSIIFNNTTGNCNLSNVLLKEVSLRANYTDLSINNTRFFYNKKRNAYWSMVFTKNSNIIFQNSTLYNNTNYFVAEGLIVINGYAKVENSFFYNIFDAIELIGVKNGVIQGNKIEKSRDDGIDLNGCNNILITGNLIFNSIDKGISVGTGKGFSDTVEWGSSTDITIEKNIVVGCNTGIAIKDSSIAYINNNTLFDNDKAIDCYENTSGYGGGIVRINNTIIAKSHTSNITVDKLSSVTITYSLCDNELFPGKGNIMAAPEFVSPEDNNFYLLSSSPCRKAGDNGTDIGAFVYKNLKNINK